MENIQNIWQVTPATAHPVARALLKIPGFWDWGDQDSPLGNDIGADTFAAYLEFRRNRPTSTIEEFVAGELAKLGLADDAMSFNDEEHCLNEGNAEGKLAKVIAKDDFIIALAFAQLVLEGTIDPSVKRNAIAALNREGTQAVLEYRGGGADELRGRQLNELRRVLELVDNSEDPDGDLI